LKHYKKLIRNVRDYGVFIASRKALSYLFRVVYERRVYRIYGIELKDYQPREFENRGFEFRFIDSNANGVINQIEGMEEWLQGEVKKKLERGSLCLVALDGDRVAGFNLVSFKKVSVPLIGKIEDLPSDEAWSEQITVHKDYRMHSLGSELRHRIFGELKSRGIRRLCGGTLLNNVANLSLSRKVGFRELTDVHYTKMLRFEKWNYEELSHDHS
jgi:ribosomal protein S18 acetylase RimI-like enzyme